MPGTSWAKNLAGMTLTDEQMEDIPHPTLELTVHITTKFVQAFTLLGTCAVGPVWALVRKRPLAATAFRFGTRGALLGLPLGMATTYGKLRSKDDPAWVKDRCYMLRRNAGQVRVDQWTLVDSVLGSGISRVAGYGLAPGFCLGMSGAIMASAIYTNMGPGKKSE